MFDDVLEQAERHMQKAIEVLQGELGAIRAGRAHPSFLSKVNVDYYGVNTPLNQLATISAPEARLLVVQPWDKSLLPQIEKAVLKADLGLTPTNDGTVIRLPIPPLTEERRTGLLKVARKKAEEARVAIRNMRREANDAAKAREKEKKASEDEVKRTQDGVQKMTDRFIKEVDRLLAVKEEEIMEV